MKEKKESSISKLFAYAGKYKYLTIASWGLAALSAWIALVPFYDIWCIMKEVLAAATDYSKAENLSEYGWSAVGFALLAYEKENGGIPECARRNVNQKLRKVDDLLHKRSAYSNDIFYNTDQCNLYRALQQSSVRMCRCPQKIYRRSQRAKKQVHNMNYRWVNRQGEAVWINCRGTVLNDDKGKPFVMIGSINLRYGMSHGDDVIRRCAQTLEK